MKLLSDADLADLATRALWAAESGYDLALAEAHVSILSFEVGSTAIPAGVKANSAAHVAALAADAKAIRAGLKKKGMLAPKLATPPPPPSTPAPPVLVVEEKLPVIDEPALTTEVTVEAKVEAKPAKATHSKSKKGN